MTNENDKLKQAVESYTSRKEHAPQAPLDSPEFNEWMAKMSVEIPYTEVEKLVERGSKLSIDELPDFFAELLEIDGTYGNVARVTAIAAAVTAKVFGRFYSISGFQAGCIQWDFIRHWGVTDGKCGMKILNYQDLCYPQNVSDITTIPKETFKAMQKFCKERIDDSENKFMTYQTEHGQWELDINEYVKKHPDYWINRKYYDHIGFGTSEEHDEYNKRKAEGFEFAPREPVYGGACKEVLNHWRLIVAGFPPKGFKVESDTKDKTDDNEK